MFRLWLFLIFYLYLGICTAKKDIPCSVQEGSVDVQKMYKNEVHVRVRYNLYKFYIIIKYKFIYYHYFFKVLSSIIF